MLFGWPVELIIAILVLIVVTVIYFVILHSQFKRYKDAEQLAGTVLMEIEPSRKTKILRKAENIFVVIFVGFIYVRDYIVNNTSDFNHIILIIGFIAAVLLQSKPQKICEKGIVVQSGLVTWDNIQEIAPVDDMDDKIKIKLKKHVNNSKKIVLYCTPDEILNVVRLIERKTIDMSSLEVQR